MRRKKIKRQSKFINEDQFMNSVKEKLSSMSYEEKEKLHNRLYEKIMNKESSEEEITIFFVLASCFFI